MPADQSGSASEVPPSGGPSGPELPSIADAPPNIRHNSSELAPVVTELDMAVELSRTTQGYDSRASSRSGAPRCYRGSKRAWTC